MTRVVVSAVTSAVLALAAPPSFAAFSGYYKIVARHSGKAVVVQGASTANAANVYQWTYGGTGTNDEWELLDLGTGYHRLVARHSGKVLNVSGASTANGANVDQWSWANVNQQMWQVTDLGTGYHRLTARHSGKVLDVNGASTADGANVHQWTWSGGTNQQFQIASVDATPVVTPTPTATPLSGATPTPTPTPTATAIPPGAIVIDGTRGGRTFDGVGAISGGGGNTRLLVDYPEPQRSQILDYLFKPGFGAAIQLLKVEVGGDANSTDGAEPSHKHTRSDLNCDRGYEWWLMKEAKARNPQIKLAGLAWAAPGWIGGHNFWSQDMVDYYMSWLDCAASHGLAIDYLGGWNERGHDKAWYQNLHAALAARGGNVKVVGDDMVGWQVADDMAADPAFKAAVDVIGGHYNCGYTSSSAGISCTGTVGGKDIAITANALNSGRPIWNSETGSQDYQTGAIPMARVYNRGYLDSKMTGYLNWPVIAALTPNLAWSTRGLILANQPWSGAYTVGRSLWATAHHTQFTAPGWKYIDSASGFIGGNRGNGSYVTRKSPNGIDYSIVLETLDAPAVQTVSFSVTGGLSTGTVHVWATHLTSTNPAEHFLHVADVTPAGAQYTLTLQPGYVYSVTTTEGQGKGTVLGPAGHALALPYSDSFDSYAVGKEARYLADMDGAYEVVACAGRVGRCVRQMSSEAPIAWGTLSDPSALLGDTSWSHYTLTADALMPQTGYVELQGRVGTQQAHAPAKVNAYFLRVSSAGAWSILKSNTSATLTTLASGTAAAPGTNTWHTYSVTFNGSTISARLDGATLGSVTDTSYATGQVGIACSRWINAQFDNLIVTPLAAATLGGTFEILNRKSGLALEVVGAQTAEAAKVDQWSYGGGGHQQWRVVSVGGGDYELVNVGSGKVLAVPSTSQGAALEQQADAGTTVLRWQIQPSSDGSYTLLNRASSLRADVSGGSTANGAPVIQWPANSGANQKWLLMLVP